MWLRLTQNEFNAKLHHRDVVGVALQRLKRDLENPARHDEAVADIQEELKHH